MTRLLTFLLCSAFAAAAHAEIYQWKDEQGRIHFGEEVPAKYQKSAVVKDTSQVNVMKAAEAAKPGPAAEAAPPPRDDAQEQAEEGAGTPEEQCAADTRKYEESQACLQKYLNAWGRVTPEALANCPEVPRPECLMRR